ncbi:sulfatase-like hydrolase/transferase [bacterium]|nr:sulfatase-like hydrolase/transferase [candidate division CSSED10-310 bacterium]
MTEGFRRAWVIFVFLMFGMSIGCRQPECSGTRTEPGNQLSFEDFRFDRWQLLRIGSKRPDLLVHSLPFRSTIESPASVYLDRDYHVEYVPLTTEDLPNGPIIEIRVVADNCEHVLSRDAPVSLAACEANPYGNLGKTVRVDLSRFTGKTVNLRWEFKNVPPGIPAYIARPGLKPVQPDFSKPHILLICSDAHRFDHVIGTTGETLMPRITSFRKSAVTYTGAAGNASWTLPSIASTLTGVFPRYHGTGQRVATGAMQKGARFSVDPGQFYAYWGGNYYIFTAFPRNLPTLTEILRENGYATTMVLANSLYTLSGLAGYGQDIVIDAGVMPGDVVNDSALRILQIVDPDTPQFMLVHYMDVHQYLSWYHEKKYPDFDPAQHSGKCRESYETAVADSDRYIGDLIDAWTGRFGSGSSLIVVYADHGEHLRAPGGHGNTMNEVLLHVPLIVRYPGTRQPVSTIDAPVSLIDIFPTVLSTAGIRDLPDYIHGEVLPVSAVLEHAERTLFADYQLYDDELASVRKGPFKYIKNLADEAETLVDTRLPPLENTETDRPVSGDDLKLHYGMMFSDYMEKAAGMRAERNIVSEEIVDPGVSIEKLKALGYIRE